MPDYIEVDFYIGDVYCGKRKVGKNSIVGALLLGDLDLASIKIAEMTSALNTIPGVQAGTELAAETTALVGEFRGGRDE